MAAVLTGLLTAAGFLSAGMFAPEAYNKTFGAKRHRRNLRWAELLGQPSEPDLTTLLANEQDTSDMISAMEDMRMGMTLGDRNLSQQSAITDVGLSNQLSDLISQDSERQIAELSRGTTNDPTMLLARMGYG